MHWQESDVKDAFYIFIELLKKGKVSKKEREIINTFRNPDVRKIIVEVIESTANVKIFEADDGLYLVPNVDNDILTYSNKELKDLLNLKNNSELYLMHFAILVLLSKYYNSEDQSISTRQFVRVEKLQNSINKHIEEFKTYTDSEKEEFMEENELDIVGIIECWESLPVFNEFAKNIRRTRNNRIGFLLHILNFLENENLVIVYEDTEIRITEKLEILVSRYYYDSRRKEKIMSLLNQ